MSDEFIGEIRLFPYLRGAPRNWALCNGQIVNISNYDQLYALIGTTYGGDGISTFALPNLNGRVPVGKGQLPGGGNYTLGQTGGVDMVTLAPSQGIAHDHAFMVSSTMATTPTPSPNVVFSAVASPTNRYAVPAASNPVYAPLAASALENSGSSAPPQ